MADLTARRHGPSWASRLVWLLMGLAAGIGLGWAAGTYAGCQTSSSGCVVRWQAFEAAGTWVGGLGTIAAVLAAVAAFRSEEAARRAEATESGKQSAAEEKRVQEEAQQITLKCIVGASSGDVMHELRFTVFNETAETDILYLECDNEDYGPIPFPKRIHPLDSHSGSIHFRQYSYAPPGAPEDPGIPQADWDGWLREQVTKTTLTFRMNDRDWRKVGNGPATAVEA